MGGLQNPIKQLKNTGGGLVKSQERNDRLMALVKEFIVRLLNIII
jgi:hypothetical protein